jgi:hypothetical protein
MTQPENNISDFDCINIRRWKILLNKNFPAGFTAEKIDPAKITDGIRGPFVKVPSSKFANVFKSSLNFAGNTHKIYLKFYLYRSVWDFVKHLIRPARGQRAYKAALMLAANGLKSPEIIAMGTNRLGPFCTKNFLITKSLEGAGPSWQYIKGDKENARGRLDDTYQRAMLLRKLGETVGKMHAKGIFHGDLRSGNVFVKKIDGKWEFFLLDNERTKKYTRIRKRLRLKNLVQINMFEDGLSKRDRMRFFKAYLNENPALDRNEWANLVTQKTRARLQKSRS